MSDSIFGTAQLTVIKSVSAVTAAAAYAAGNAVGAKRVLVDAVRQPKTGILHSVAILDRSSQRAPLTMLFFDSNPLVATITDKAAFVFSTDDLKLCAQVLIAASDYTTTNVKAYAQLAGLNIPIKILAGQSLYLAVVTTGTPTYAAVDDVQIEIGLLID